MLLHLDRAADLRMAMVSVAEDLQVDRRAIARAVDTAEGLLGSVDVDPDAHLRLLADDLVAEAHDLARRLELARRGTGSLPRRWFLAHPGGLAGGGGPYGFDVLGHLPRRSRIASVLGPELRDRLERERVIRTGTPEEVRQFFLAQAYERAGIDPEAWDPSQGLDHNRAIVQRVYDYYADLYRNGDDHLWWAGMAALIGPSFAAGFEDLERFGDWAGAVGDVADFFSAGPIDVVRPTAFGSDAVAGLTEDELRWYQERLLSMQLEIFEDMAPAYEAFTQSGMEGIAALYADDRYAFGPETIGAWQQIADGLEMNDPALIAAGNESLLWREQRYVIDDDYRAMRQRPVTGETVTYMMTVIGTPSVPGARGYPFVFPWEPDVSQYAGTPRSVSLDPIPFFDVPFVDAPSVAVPHVGLEGTVTVTTPLPDGNIATLVDRWRLIETDTLPAYLDLVQNDPERIHAELAAPFEERVDRYDLGSRWDDIAEELATAWDIDADVDWEVGW